MPQLWVPRQVKDRLVADRHEADAETNLLVDQEVARRVEAARRFDVELKRIDPYLEVAYINRPPAWPDDIDPPDGIVWNRWHVVRRNPDAPDTYRAITGQEGSYREPDSGVLEELAREDSWSSRSLDRAARRRARRAAESQRAKDREREQLRDELAERIKSAATPQVSFARAGAWSNRAGARRNVRP